MGQKNGHARIWAKTGTRPRRPADQRYANAYLFGAIGPMGAKGAALMLPFANTRAMQMHLDEISCNVAAAGAAEFLCRETGISRIEQEGIHIGCEKRAWSIDPSSRTWTRPTPGSARRNLA